MFKIHLANEQKAGLIIALLILIIGNLQDISSAFVRPADLYTVNLCNPKYSSDIKIAETEKNNLYIPNYDAEIFITPAKNEFQINDNIQFYLKIEDKGIIKMEQPYFYVLLYNPSGKLQGIFPCFCGQEQNDFNFGASCSNDYCYISNPKLPLWPTTITYTKNGQAGWQCKDNQNRFCINYQKNEYCASREEFLKGQSDDNHSLIYEFKASEAGTWKIYVFIFDSQYQDRNGNIVSGTNFNNPYNNAVAYGYEELQVSSKLPEIPAVDYMWIFQKALLAGFSLIGYYGTSKGLYRWSVKKFGKYKRELIGTIVLFILILSITFLMVSIKCG